MLSRRLLAAAKIARQAVEECDSARVIDEATGDREFGALCEARDGSGGCECWQEAISPPAELSSRAEVSA